MSILFADIFEAIRTLRVCKGTTEKDILNYVQERAGGCLSVNNVLKTVCTLNKLVNEGVLEKKGKRYSLPKPPPKQEDDEDMDQEEEKEDECENEDDDDDMKDSCDDIGGDDDEDDCPDNKCDEEDEDDDDDDDEDEEDDDDDEEDNGGKNNEEEDDDDDNCNDKMESNDKKEEKKDDCPENEAEIQNNRNGSGSVNSNGNGNGKNGPRSKTENGELNCSASFDNKSPEEKITRPNKSRRFNSKSKAETIAFCARDFMDAQYRTYGTGPVTEAFAKMEDVMEEDAEFDEKPTEVSNLFQARKRGTRSKRSHMSNSNYRSRSPVKGIPTDAYQHRLDMEQSDEIGPLNHQMFQEPGDMDLDIEPNRRGDLIGVDFDLYRHRSPAGSPLPEGPEGVNGKESCCSTQDKKEIKAEPGLEGITQCGLKRHAESAMTMLRGKEKSRKNTGEAMEKHKRDGSNNKAKENEEDEKDKMHMSVCSVCEKKKKKKKI